MTHHDNPDDRHMPYRNGAAVPTAEADQAADHLGQEDADTKSARGQNEQAGIPSRAPGGLSSGLQPGGTAPGKSPGASVGSLGTGGGSTANHPTGAVKKGL